MNCSPDRQLLFGHVFCLVSHNFSKEEKFGIRVSSLRLASNDCFHPDQSFLTGRIKIIESELSMVKERKDKVINGKDELEKKQWE